MTRDSRPFVRTALLGAEGVYDTADPRLIFVTFAEPDPNPRAQDWKSMYAEGPRTKLGDGSPTVAVPF